MSKGTLIKSLIKGSGGSGGGGGGDIGTGDYNVKVIDYDGTVIDEQWLDDGAEYILPSAPSHEGLVFQEWSSSETITDGKITIDKNNVMIGAIYTTASGQTEADIELTPVTGLSAYFAMNGTKDWGDGTVNSSNSHTYTNYGKYTIKCNGTAFTNGSSSGLFGQASASSSYTYVNWYAKNVRIANVATITGSLFSGCISLETITISKEVTQMTGSNSFNYMNKLKALIIPKSITSITLIASNPSIESIVIPNSVETITSFQNNTSLKNLVIPKSVKSCGVNFNHVFSQLACLEEILLPDTIQSIGLSNFMSNCYSLKKAKLPNNPNITSIGDYLFYQNYCLDNVEIPNNITSVGARIFQDCRNLKKVVLSENLTSIPTLTFSNCSSLPNVKIPKSVTSIEAQAFEYCRACLEYDFSELTSIPTLSNTNAFNGINKLAKIKVPTALYSQWITETNWSTYADYIVAV